MSVLSVTHDPAMPIQHTRYRTEVVARTMQMLGSSNSNSTKQEKDNDTEKADEKVPF
jgi:single-stranded DNA-binding protein